MFDLLTAALGFAVGGGCGLFVGNWTGANSAYAPHPYEPKVILPQAPVVAEKPKRVRKPKAKTAPVVVKPVAKPAVKRVRKK